MKRHGRVAAETTGMLGMLHAAVLAGAVGCNEPDRPAKVLHAVTPVEPQMAQMQGINGTVVVLVTLAADGTVADARIGSSPSALLNASALAAARTSTFQGAIHDCVPVGATYSFYADYNSDGLERRIQVTSKGETEALVQAYGQVLRPATGAILEFAIVTFGEVVAEVSAKNAAAAERFGAGAKSLDGVRAVRISELRTGHTRPAPDRELYAARIVSVIIGAQDLRRIARALTTKDVMLTESVTWTLDDERSAEKEAAANALRNAQRDAESLAKTRGLRVVRLREVNTEHPRWQRFSAPLSNIEGTPDVEVLVPVTATYLLGTR